jgi:isoquinoline 1-oxidoreductase alpha subunit
MRLIFSALRYVAVPGKGNGACFSITGQLTGKGSVRILWGAVMIQLKVNGAGQTFDGDPEMPLLWYLRDMLGLTGSKFGCGIGLCGACTVHVNGQATRSCVTVMRDAAAKEVTTIEGLDKNGLHPVQKAWMQINVPQCGYCQVGQIMQAAAFLSSKKRPSDAEIDEAMTGNICRCGTYQRIRAAIKTAAGEMA